VAAVTDAPPTSAERADSSGGAAALLDADRITVGFGGLLALDEVSMSVGQGEVVGVIGPNGAGKTTLFNVISGFVHPDSGTISYRGAVLRRHRPHDLAKLGIARTLQGIGLCPGLRRSSREERRVGAQAMAMLDELGAANAAHRLPAALPYAVQKRTALARALMARPQLLLLDEPASGLSESEMDALGTRIRALAERMSVIMVEHHMDLVMSVCDRLVVLNYGQVIAEGTPAMIRADPDVGTAYLGDPVHVDTPPGASGESIA
jgi:branched-chain amino acid transport system ATP-binding protein